jgi:hypothetical protein
VWLFAQFFAGCCFRLALPRGPSPNPSKISQSPSLIDHFQERRDADAFLCCSHRRVHLNLLFDCTMTTMFKFKSFRSSLSSLDEKIEDDYSIPPAPHAVDDILTTVQKEEWYRKPLTILVVGASGDLAKKKTYPALLELWKAKLLPASPTTVIYGFARTPHSHEQLRKHLK